MNNLSRSFTAYGGDGFKGIENHKANKTKMPREYIVVPLLLILLLLFSCKGFPISLVVLVEYVII